MRLREEGRDRQTETAREREGEELKERENAKGLNVLLFWQQLSRQNQKR